MQVQLKISHIHQKIKRVNLQRKALGQKLYTLNPTLTESEIQNFENQHDIILPEEYRAFLLQIGNGNQEEYEKGIKPLFEADKFNKNDEECLDLKTPFPFTGEVGLEIIRENIYRYYPAKRVRDILDENNINRLAGCLLINYEGWGSSHIALIISGEQRAKVWHVDDLYHPFYTRKGNSFIGWNMNWIRNSLLHLWN